MEVLKQSYGYEVQIFVTLSNFFNSPKTFRNGMIKPKTGSYLKHCQ